MDEEKDAEILTVLNVMQILNKSTKRMVRTGHRLVLVLSFEMKTENLTSQEFCT